MIKFQRLPKDLRRRLVDPHDALGRWSSVHPALSLCLPLPIYKLDNSKSKQPKLLGWSFTVTFAGGIAGSIEMLGSDATRSPLSTRNGRSAAEAVHTRLEELAIAPGSIVFRPALLLVPETRMRYIWLRAPGDGERFVPVIHELRSLTREEFDADCAIRREHAAIGRPGVHG